MCRPKRYILSFLFILLVNQLQAQNNITGTWEGDLGDDQFLQLNIIQNGNKLCGYTWDYVKADQRSHCKAYFKAHYDELFGTWKFKGTSFIEKTSSVIERDSIDFNGDSVHIEEHSTHFLMWLSLSSHSFNGEDILKGFFIADPPLFASFSYYREDTAYLREHVVYLKRVAPRPQQIMGEMQDCFLEEQKVNNTITDPAAVVRPADSIMIIPTALAAAKDSVNIPKQLAKRKNTEQSHIEVNVKNITLNVYDNAIVDGDTISIFYNGRLLLSHRLLSEKPIVINLELDEKQTRHEIILFAENLGSIPPNTALIVIYAGDKRYELFSSASLEENAVLIFDYRPK